jgi:hypothetical protein
MIRWSRIWVALLNAFACAMAYVADLTALAVLNAFLAGFYVCSAFDRVWTE